MVCLRCILVIERELKALNRYQEQLPGFGSIYRNRGQVHSNAILSCLKTVGCGVTARHEKQAGVGDQKPVT